MPFNPLPNDPNPSIDQRSVPGKDNIQTDTKRHINPTPAHVNVRSMPPPSEPTGSAPVPRIKSSPSRESLILSQEQKQNQQKRADLIINSQAENKKMDDMPKAQQKDEPQHEYPDRDDGKTPSINYTPETAAPGPGVSIQVTISVVPDQRKSLNVNIPTTFSVNGNWNENVIPNNTPQSVPKPQAIPNNTDPQAVPKPQLSDTQQHSTKSSKASSDTQQHSTNSSEAPISDTQQHSTISSEAARDTQHHSTNSSDASR